MRDGLPGGPAAPLHQGEAPRVARRLCEALIVDNPPPTRPTVPSRGPSREMFGGPLVGVVAFVIIAIGLGWGLIALFNGMLDQTRRDVTSSKLNHGFDTRGSYVLRKPMLLGYSADGRLLLFPERGDLPAGAPGRRTAATIEGYLAYRAKVESGGTEDARFRDLVGVVDAGTVIRINQVIEDADNAQTRLLLGCTVLSGTHEGVSALGLHLETRSTDEKTGKQRYDPRAELIAPDRTADSPEAVQSETEPPPGSDPAPPPDAP
ncbi:MAG: hypothetical protein AAGH88_02615 [Planctomycetota bacterium]